MKIIATSNTFTNHVMCSLKTIAFTIVFFVATFIAQPLFAQEEVIKNAEVSSTKQIEEVAIEEPILEEAKPIEESAPVEVELSKEQLKEIAKLDRLLKQGKITQEEYDQQLADITGVKPVEEEALAAKSSAQVEPEAQTLGKYIAPTVSTSNGSLNYSYPIVVPPGRNGLTPEIALTYNSTNKSQSSMVGIGWSFNIPYIQRVNKKGIDKLYTDDHFISSLDGELVDQGSGVFTPRTENGSFLEYEYSNDIWTITDKQGTTYKFGATAQARQDNSADTTQIFSWMLETITDTNGNTIDYTYFKDQGQIYPNAISYADGLFDVAFNRVARTSPNTAYSSAFEVTTDWFINEVEVSTSNSVTATYDVVTTDMLVDDITVTGYEGTSSFELPAVEFEYTSDVSNNEFIIDSNFGFDHELSGATRFADLNGDGLTDAISSYVQNSLYVWNVRINDGSGFNIEPNDWDKPVSTMAFKRLGNGNPSYDLQLVDINSDGLTDLVDLRGYPLGNGASDNAKVYINDGSSFVLDTSFGFDHERDGATRFADLNGDGLTDAISSYSSGSLYVWNVHINTGSDFDTHNIYTSSGNYVGSNLDWEMPVPTMAFRSQNGSTSYDLQLVDINSDGLVDLVDLRGYPLGNGASNNAKMYINDGSSFVLDTNFGFDHERSGATKFTDLNGDGLVDAISSYYSGGLKVWNVHINSGSNFVTHNIYTSSGNYVGSNLDWAMPDPNMSFISNTGSNPQDIQFVDIDADGISDLVDLRGYPLGNGASNNAKVYINGAQGSTISKLTNPQQGATEFIYTVANIQDTSNKVPFSIHVIESMTTDDNNGNTGTTSYEYRDADYYFNTFDDKKFAGFGSVIKTNPDSSVETIKYHQANGETGNESTDSYAKIGKAYEQSIEDGSSNLFSLNRTNYTESILGGISNSIQALSQLSMQYDGTGTHTDTATGYSYDSYGNVTAETQYGVVSGNVDGTFTDSGLDKRIIDRTYTNDTTNYIVGLPTNQTLKNNSGTTEAESDFTYDTDGNLLTKSDWITGSDYSNTTYTYNSYGLPLTETDALSNTTIYAYDTEDMYPATVTNAESHISSYSYNYSSGKPETVTEANGKVTEYDYDGLDRLLEIKGTIANGGTQTLKDITYNTTSTPQYAQSTTYTGTESQDVYSYVDGFGKTIQTKSEMGSSWVTLDTVYDDMNRVEKQSLPYETSSSSNSSATSNADLMTSFSYDALGRVLSTVNTKGTTSTNYSGFETSITDAESNEKDLVTDAFGNLVTVKEHNGASVYTTDYQYNSQNLLTKITDEENNVRNIDYDGLGRRTELEDLHSSSDGTFGTWDFSYDDINMSSQTDPKGTTTNYTYDDINRVLTEDNSSVAGVEVTYSYDSCTNGTGQLCSVVTPDLTTSYTYLKQGLVDTEAKLIDAVTYTTDIDYNRQGAVTKVTHPNASYTEYDYNTRGMVDDVKYNGTSLVTADYGVHGRPVVINHTNGVDSTLTYDATELYELTNKTTTDGTTDFQDLSYSYDNVGNISQIVDGSDTDTGKTQTFTYDDLYRLTGTSVTNSANTADYSRSYSYSPIGNITAFDGTTYLYTDTGYSNPHAVTNIGGTSYIYDNNGNLTNDGTWTHSWDYRNRLTSSTDGTATSSYEYDSNNQRIKLLEGTDTTIYPTGDYEVKNGDVKISLNLGESLVATDDNGTINHVHTDHLGGTNITTDTLGVITQTLDYYPYGDTRIDVGTDNETKQFTGYIKDSVTGLNYAGARYYAGKTGRFISQDPANLRLGINEKTELGKILTNPQLLNTYSYAGNDPVNNTDDNGELSLRAALTNPFAIPASLGLSAIAEFGGNNYNIPVSQQLLQHSLGLEPKNQYAGQDSSVANVIQGSNLFNSELERQITEVESSGRTEASFDLNLNFRQDGNTDAYSAIGSIDLNVQGSQNENGAWDLSFSGNDTYDYGYNKSDWKANFPFGAGANILSIAQKLEISSKYDTKVEFKKESYSTKKDNNNTKKGHD
jgi:RHS repeat-associated protein